MRDDPSTGLIQITGSTGVDRMLGHLKYALHNIFLLVVAAGALTLLINLFSWAVGLSGHGYQDYAGAGYQGYQAPGESLHVILVMSAD